MDVLHRHHVALANLLGAALLLASPAGAANELVNPSIASDRTVERSAPTGAGPFLEHVEEPSPLETPEIEAQNAVRVETSVDLGATLFLPGRADPSQWMATGTWARITYDGIQYQYGYDPLVQTYDLLVSGYADPSGIILQETVGVMAVQLPTLLVPGQVERVECWFAVNEHNLYPFEAVGITAMEDEFEPRGDLNSIEAQLLYEDARGFRGNAYALAHFEAGAHAIDLGAIAVDDLEEALTGKGWFGVGFAADGWDLSGSLGQQVFWRVGGGGSLPESGRPFFRVTYNAPPDPFALISPANDLVITLERPALTWEAATDANGDDPMTYRVEIASNPLFIDAISFDAGTSTSALVPLALSPATYHWRVTATDARGATRESPTHRLFVASSTDVPTSARAASLTAVPNPFNPRTQILLELPRRSTVALSVIDLRGRRIRSLHHGVLEAGAASFIWDGRDAGGSPCASGVYELRAVVDGESISRRVSLVR